MTAFSEPVLLLAAAVLLLSVAAVRWSTRIGVPTLLVYLAFGVLLGESFVGIQFSDAELTRKLGTLALVLIIAEGGLTERWSRMRPVIGSSISLATVGVLVSVGVVALSAHYLLGQDWRTSALIGAIISSTDAAAVFSVFRRLPIKPRLRTVLESESGMNDPTAVLLVILLSSPPGQAPGPWWWIGLLLIFELAVGLLIGLVTGALGVWLLRRAALPAAGLYPLAAVGLMILAYAGGAVLHASGFMAVYVAAVVLGNARLPHRQAIMGFADGVAWLAQIGLFVLLGLLVSPPGLPGVLIPALIIGCVLTFVARPLSVAVSIAPFGRIPLSRAVQLGRASLGRAVRLSRARLGRAVRLSRARRLGGARPSPAGGQADSGGRDAPAGGHLGVSAEPRKGVWGWREQAFLSWAGLRGAVPIVFATIPLAARVPNATWLFNVTFVLVVVFTLVQASTLPTAARLLRVAAPDEPTELRVETAPLERMQADLLQLDIPPGSQLAGVHLDELRLPVGASVTLVLREGAGFVPSRGTRLQTGDSLLIVATDEVRDETERRLRAVSRRGRLARWFGEEGTERND